MKTQAQEDMKMTACNYCRAGRDGAPQKITAMGIDSYAAPCAMCPCRCRPNEPASGMAWGQGRIPAVVARNAAIVR